MELYAIELRTDRWEEALAWYRHALGISVAVRIPEDQYALLIAGHSRIALMGRETPRANDRVSLAFEVDDLAAVEAGLTAAGAEFRRVEDHPDGLKMVTTTDPDGNRIRLFCWPEKG